MSSVFCLTNITSEFKCSLRLALPLVAAEVIYALNSFIATIMIAHLGKYELAASALVWNIQFAISLFFIGILCAISIMVAQSLGAKDNNGISTCFKQGLIMAIIFSLPMMLIMYFAPTILIWAKQDPDVISCAQPFFRSLIWAMLPLNLVIAIQQFLIGITKTKLVMLMSILIVPIQIFFYYIFLFGKFGIPKTNLSGIGYGLAISHALIAVFFISYLCLSVKLKKYELFKKWWVIDKQFFSELFRVGFPQGLMWSSEVSFFAVVAIMMGLFSVTTLAAYQIAEQFLLIALVTLFAISHNTAIRVGYEVGRNNRDKIKLTTVVNIAIGLVLISIFILFYTFFPELAIGLDIDINSEHYKDIAAETLKFFPIVGVVLITDCFRLVANGALRGLKDTKFQLYISVLGYWLIAFPAAYLLGFKFGLGSIGIWWGNIIGIIATSIMLFFRFNKLYKKINLLSLVTKK